MKHAGPKALNRLEPLIARIRDLPGLVEKTRGAFYRKSRAFLHFHEDPHSHEGLGGLFADIRVEGDDFERIDVTEAGGADRLVAMARACLGVLARVSKLGAFPSNVRHSRPYGGNPWFSER